MATVHNLTNEALLEHIGAVKARRLRLVAQRNFGAAEVHATHHRFLQLHGATLDELVHERAARGL